jgi:4-amino-4-deoxy-L-arabinose transferase-like glycosyltransferase
MTHQRQLRMALWVCFGALLALAWWRPMALPDEGRYGDIGRFMMVSGDWLAPRLDGLPFFHKPPLLHWLQAAALSVAGVHVWVSRLVIASHAMLMLWTTAWLACRLWGPAWAVRAVLMLGSSLAFLIGGQYINHDMVVAAWISLAIAAFGLAMQNDPRPHRGLAWLGFAACGLGVLAKGLIGLALPGLVMVGWVTLTRQWPKALKMPWFSGLSLLALIALPWFIRVEQVHPGVFDYLVIGQHFGRYTGNTFNNPWPWWFYPATLVGLLFPWALLTYGAALHALWRAPLAWWRPVAPGRALLWVWLIAIVVFFSLPRSKLVGYILPVLPPLTLLAADAWQRAWGARRAVGHAVLAGIVVLNVALAVWANHAAGAFTKSRSSADVARHLACRMQATDAVWVAGAYPYDLPYLARLTQPVVVLADWEQARRTAGDNWQRELFEGADFDPAMAGRVLRPLTLLDQPPVSGVWLVTPKEGWPDSQLPQWRLVMQGQAWTLWRPVESAGKGPETAQHIGLDCGDDHRDPQ